MPDLAAAELSIPAWGADPRSRKTTGGSRRLTSGILYPALHSVVGGGQSGGGRLYRRG